MASLLDAVQLTKQLGFYETVFPFLLVAAITYGVLMKHKPFGEKQVVNIVVASISGLLFISFVKTSQFLQFAMPMLTIFMIIFLFIFMTFLFIGVKEGDIARALTKETSGYMIIIFIVVIIAVVSIQQIFPEFSYGAFPELAPENATFATGLEGQPSAPAAGANVAQQFALQQFMGTIFHPTIVALTVMFLIFAIGVYFITREAVK
jgi:hypothetical protein